MFGKMKFIFVLLLLALIIDCKKLRNQSKTTNHYCNFIGEKCGAFRKICCSDNCIYEHWYSFTGICAKKK